MARGWESKSVEAQQEEAAQRKESQKPLLTREQASLVREIASLRLSVKRVDEQLSRSQNSRHRAMLEQAKSDLEREIEARESARSGH
jgi:predicted FMN-binding regulatory protein PaiB